MHKFYPPNTPILPRVLVVTGNTWVDITQEAYNLYPRWAKDKTPRGRTNKIHIDFMEKVAKLGEIELKNFKKSLKIFKENQQTPK